MDFQNLTVKNGITNSQVDQLIEFTNQDPDIKKYTSDLSRFFNKDSFIKWVRDKYIYTLSDKEGNLLGLVWFEKKLLPEEILDQEPALKDLSITIAIRIYSDARGKGYFRLFLSKALEEFKAIKEYENLKGFWVSIAKENIPSKTAFLRFGFKEIGQNPKRIFMIWPDTL